MSDSKSAMWQEPAVPRTVVQFIPVSIKTREFLLLHRSPAVRSARNCWSFPSGLHDIGDTLEETVVRELHEELHLTAATDMVELIGSYENIAGDEPGRAQYHWVLLMFVVYVDDFAELINVEDDKHDFVETLPIGALRGRPVTTALTSEYTFHHTLSQWIADNGETTYRRIVDRLKTLTFDERE